jgi:hypothetical protein
MFLAHARRSGPIRQATSMMPTSTRPARDPAAAVTQPICSVTLARE